MNGYEANKMIEGGEDAILGDAAQSARGQENLRMTDSVTNIGSAIAELDTLRSNQQQLVRVLFNLCVALALNEQNDKIMPLSKAREIAMKVLDHVHHDELDKTLGEIARDMNADEIQRIFSDS